MCISFDFRSAHSVAPLRGVGIEYLNDPESYAGWNIMLLVGSKERGQTKHKNAYRIYLFSVFLLTMRYDHFVT